MNDAIRSQFPSLKRIVNGRPIVHFDGPAGTQVPQSVIDAMVRVYSHSNANSHGQFVTAHETDQLINHCRSQVAELLGAEGPDTISFGANMTTLNFTLANAIARTLQPGDEILITQLDHEANQPQAAMALAKVSGPGRGRESRLCRSRKENQRTHESHRHRISVEHIRYRQ